MKLKTQYYVLSLLLPIQWVLINWLSNKTTWIEEHYSQGIYTSISNLLQSVLGSIPVSIGDLLYALLIFYMLKWIYTLIKERVFHFKTFIFKGLSIVSICYFLFYFNWGLNYFRSPLKDIIQLEKTKYTNDELFEVTSQLLKEANELHTKLASHDSILLNLEASYTKKQIRQIARQGYQNLPVDIPNHELAQSDVKVSLFSLPLSYMGFAGYLNPWTNEAQINTKIPLNAYAATACHEIAHQLGHASESEANFIGYLAGISSEDQFVQYSTTVMALRYCLFEVYKRDSDTYKTYLAEINLGIKKDFKARSEFWNSYQNWSEPFFKLFYDSYLKVNNQKHGIQSYNQMVGLVVNFHLQNTLK